MEPTFFSTLDSRDIQPFRDPEGFVTCPSGLTNALRATLRLSRTLPSISGY
jgi:hypothetical protein